MNPEGLREAKHLQFVAFELLLGAQDNHALMCLLLNMDLSCKHSKALLSFSKTQIRQIFANNGTQIC